MSAQRVEPRMLPRLLATVTLSVAAAGGACAATASAPGGPAFAPATPEEAHDLDAAARDLEKRIERSGRLLGLAELDAYLQGVADRLLASDPAAPPQPVRVRAIKDASANAFVLPNGAVFVTTELLCDLDDEAELAAILGHEITHYANQHLLRERRDQRHKAATSHALGNIFGVLLTIVAARYGTGAGDIGAIPQKVLDVWSVASVAGYSRDLEREADREGMRRMAAAGYDVSGAVRVFEKLAAAAPAVGASEPVKYASHPKLEERRRSAQDLVTGEFQSATGAGREVGRDAYHARTAGLGLDQAAVLLESGKPERAGALLRAEIARQDSARAAYLEGEAARAAVPRTAATEAQAIAAYTRATTLPGTPVSSYRQLGLLYRERGERDAAVRALQAYLERAPESTDAPLVRLYLTGLAAPQSSAPPKQEEP